MSLISQSLLFLLTLVVFANADTIHLLYMPIAIHSDESGNTEYSDHAHGNLAAVQLAVQTINADPALLAGHTLSLSVLDTQIDNADDAEFFQKPQKGIKLLDDQMRAMPKFHLLLGPNNELDAEIIPWVATSYNLLQISHFVLSRERSSRVFYPDFFRLSPPATTLVNPFIDLLDNQYEITHISFVAEKASKGCVQFSDEVYSYLLKQSKVIHKNLQIESTSNFREIAKELQTNNEVSNGQVKLISLSFDSAIAGALICSGAQEGIRGDGGWVWVISQFGLNRREDWLDVNFINSNYGTNCQEQDLKDGLKFSLFIAADYTESDIMSDQSGAIHGFSTADELKTALTNEISSSFSSPSTQTLHSYKWLAFDSVFAAAQALQSLSDSSENFTAVQTDGDEFRFAFFGRLKSALEAVEFVGVNGPISFDNNTGERRLVFRVKQFSDEAVSGSLAIENLPTIFLKDFTQNTFSQPDGTTAAVFANGKSVPDSFSPDMTLVILGAVVGGLIIFLLLVCAIFLLVYKLWYVPYSEIASLNWKIHSEEVVRKKINMNASMSASLNSMQEKTVRRPYETVQYNGKDSVLYTTVKPLPDLGNRLHALEFKAMKKLHHENVIGVYGVIIDSGPVQGIVGEYAGKGTLADIVINGRIKYDPAFRYSILKDIASGMQYIHEHPDIGFHGSLRSACVMLDTAYVPKVCDFGIRSFRKDFLKSAQQEDLLWTAPEVLVGMKYSDDPEVRKMHDVYSFAIVMSEVLVFKYAYNVELANIEATEIIDTVRKGTEPPMRPRIDVSSLPTSMYTLLKTCWAQKPDERISFEKIVLNVGLIVREENINISNLMETLLVQMDKYALNLEDVVAQKTLDFLEQKKNAEKLLYSILPESVAHTLKNGGVVEPQTYESTTIYFSDVVSFTALSAASTPIQVVNLLNDLYTCFDAVIEKYDAYKVETIGDAYMVISGLPHPNGIEHARIMTKLSLDLLYETGFFKIRHMPNKQMKLRIGNHTGSAVSGVVGMVMPRYTVFGDSVVIASTMESSGSPMQVQISAVTKDHLEQIDPKQFELVSNGTKKVAKDQEIATFFVEKDNDPENKAQPCCWPFTREDILARP